ncbi:hypothetical protein PR202_gb25430 [Eleusine coracana subsp. coracana]|uniref:non-specific serine/threonine protein kinase n=1 Tax=Eleusine coracana subsp. coracana TaxID=191504 RepID=A0AAV5FNN3_ELECO|nr:hypothetical protein PR202_gb25430 [Eleusine coracana subsp. coracana]
MGCSDCHGQLVWLLLLIGYAWVAVAQAQQARRTDPLEVAALNTILGIWGLQASPRWNISGEPCSGIAVDNTDVDNDPNIKLGIKNLRQNYLTGPLPSFIGKFTALQYLGIGSNNYTGELPEELGNLVKLEQIYLGSSGFSGPFPSTFSKLTNLRILWAPDNDFTGKIPDYLGSLTKLEDLRIGDLVNGSSSLDFISNLTSLNVLILRNCRISDNLATVNFSKLGGLTLLDLSFNNITGEIPESILNLQNLGFLFLGNNSLSGSLPDAKSPSLNNLDLSYNQLTGSFPSWATENNLQLNLVANNFVLSTSNNRYILPSGLNCLQQDTPCFRGSPEYYSFAVDCGSNRSMRGSDNTMYETDPTTLGAASYYVTGQTRWGVSNTGRFNQAPNGSYVIYSSQQFQNALDSELFQTARMSPSSLRYYGIGLENGNYTVDLQFAEFSFPDSQTWQSRGRRVFDIYVQGDLKEKNFDIRKTAGGKSFTAVYKKYNATVSKNFLEIHLFWAGKGTCCVPAQGYYGPTISALSVTPNFTPTVRNGVPKKKSKAGAITGIVIGDSGLSLNWSTRFEIIVGIARGLAYLHEESSVRIVHRDIKASNILLDTDLTPKISDFGLAKLYDEKKTHVSTKIAGTLGYLAPEYAMKGHLTEKVDVFAFGVVVLETVAGRSNTDNSLEEDKMFLFEWAWELYEKGQALDIVDPRLEEEFESEEALRVIKVALLCTQGSPHQRPPMSTVVAMLTRDFEMTQVVTKPRYITEWQLRGGNSYVTTDYSSDTTREFSEQRDAIAPLTPSPAVTGVIDGGR